MIMTMRIRSVGWFASLLFGGLMAMAQSITPPIAEFRGTKVEGMFEVSNRADYPMAVVLETKSFSVNEHGQVIYRPLDSGIVISMGISSFMLRPNDTRMIFYKARISTPPPASFSIIPTMTKAGALTGVRVNYILPHMIYVYQKEKFQKTDIKIDIVNGILRVHNLSAKLGRVQSVEASKQDSGGFPLFPGQTRELPIAGHIANITFEDGFKVSVNN